MTKTVCFFGIYDPDYSRNRVLIKGFIENDYKIVECRVDPRKNHGTKKYFELFREYKKIAKIKNEFEFVVVGFPGQTIVWLAKILFFRNIIIFDAFLSLYDSNVFDRKLYSKYNLRAMKDWFLDWHSCLLSDFVLLDTYEHIEYFNKTFYISKQKLIRVLVGTDNDIFNDFILPIKTPMEKDKFIIHFHGHYIPLQGIEYIIEAANLLKKEDFIFRIIGNGQEYKKIVDKVNNLELKNVEFIPNVDIKTLASYIKSSDICLGIFGSTQKTKRVIPNKVFEYATIGKPIITASTKAILEVFTNMSDIFLCDLSNGREIANSIMILKSEKTLANKIASNAHDLMKEKCTPKVIIFGLLDKLQKING